MPWFKVDDHFWSHPKTAELSTGATALWLRAGSWSAGHLTDGVVPKSMLRIFRARQTWATELVSKGLWTDEQTSFKFHSWDEYQPSKEVVEARRNANKKRVSDWRSGKSNGVTETFGERNSNAAPDPTRPDPSIEEAKASSPARSISLPSDWAPTAEHFERATTLGVDIAREAVAFRLHAETHDRKAVKWNAAFTSWLMKAKPSTARPRPNDEWKRR